MENRKNVLVVEDDPFLSKLLKYEVERSLACTVQVCSTGEEALWLVQRERFDLVLLDILLDGRLTGIQVARQLQRRYAVPFAFTGASTGCPWHGEAMSTRPLGFLAKPYPREKLQALLHQALPAAA